MVASETVKSVKHIAVLWILGVLIVLGLVTLALFSFGGGQLQEFLQKTYFYYGMAALSLLGMTAFAIWNMVAPQSPFANTYIFNPEKGINVFFNKSFFYTFLLFFNLTAIIGLIGAYTNTFFVARLTVVQQVTETGRLILGAEPAAFAETAFILGFLLAVVVGVLKFLSQDSKPLQNLLVYLVAPILIGLFGVAEHLLVYGEEQSALLFTFLFWSIGAWLTIGTGSIMAAYIWHFNNNLFASANALFADDTILTFTIIGLFVLDIMLIVTRISLSRRKQQQFGVTPLATT